MTQKQHAQIENEYRINPTFTNEVRCILADMAISRNGDFGMPKKSLAAKEWLIKVAGEFEHIEGFNEEKHTIQVRVDKWLKSEGVE
jgi:hypothetical protein